MSARYGVSFWTQPLIYVRHQSLWRSIEYYYILNRVIRAPDCSIQIAWIQQDYDITKAKKQKNSCVCRGIYCISSFTLNGHHGFIPYFVSRNNLCWIWSAEIIVKFRWFTVSVHCDCGHGVTRSSPQYICDLDWGHNNWNERNPCCMRNPS